MKSVRLIPRLDVKAPNLIKAVHLEGLRKIGDPNVYAKKYYESGADEILYMDAVASLYGRNSLLDIIERSTRDVFVPITVGGGIRTVTDVADALKAGADKVAINTAAVRRPELISEAARAFGSQCIVLSIEAKQVGVNRWEAYTDGGREHSGLDVVEWANRGVALGAGEILVTSIDREGTRRGFDIQLTLAIARAVKVPVIASGGMGTPAHLVEVIREGGADAVAMADILHFNRMTLPDIRASLGEENIRVRVA